MCGAVLCIHHFSDVFSKNIVKRAAAYLPSWYQESMVVTCTPVIFFDKSVVFFLHACN
jgi:hypothetical protein